MSHFTLFHFAHKVERNPHGSSWQGEVDQPLKNCWKPGERILVNIKQVSDELL